MPLSGATNRWPLPLAARIGLREPTPGSTTTTWTLPAGKKRKLVRMVTAAVTTSQGGTPWVRSTTVAHGQPLSTAPRSWPA